MFEDGFVRSLSGQGDFTRSATVTLRRSTERARRLSLRMTKLPAWRHPSSPPTRRRRAGSSLGLEDRMGRNVHRGFEPLPLRCASALSPRDAFWVFGSQLPPSEGTTKAGFCAASLRLPIPVCR